MALLEDLGAFRGMDADAILAELRCARGPAPGMGRSAGTPWRGIAEETACLWVTWFTEAARRAGLAAPQAIEVNGRRVPLVTAQLTFGQRHYFECPLCGRPVEALYFLGRECGCRKCLRLGYRSQARRPGSPWAYLDWVFARRSLWRRWELPDNVACREIVEPLRKLLAERIEAMMGQVKVRSEDGDSD